MAIDKIGSKALVDCSVAAADIAPGTITGTQLAGSIANAKLANSTVTINGTSIALGASATIAALAWQSVVVSDGSTVTTMVAGRGYFVNNTSAAGIVKLPISASAGDTIAIKDYAGNFATNKLTIQRNGHNIQGVANDSQIKTNRASVVLVYIDSTKGWLYTNESNVADLQKATFVTATGGTISTVATNFKVHVFTGDGNFVVSCAGNPVGNNKVDYLVIAGGGGGGSARTGCSSGAGGGGGGGYRESYTPAISGPYTASPLKAACGALTVTAATFPITVGAGGGKPLCGPNAPGQGNNSVFSTITSAGGGAGANNTTNQGGANGGSGGGGSNSYNNPNKCGGSGNTPPVSPPQGADGGNAVYSHGSGGGGGAGGCSGTGGLPNGNGHGGVGVTSNISGSPVGYAGGGGSGDSTAQATGGGRGGGNPGGPNFGGGNGGTRCGSSLPVRQGEDGHANTGGGGGAGASGPQRDQSGGAGGKGVVIIRYKFQ